MGLEFQASREMSCWLYFKCTHGSFPAPPCTSKCEPLSVRQWALPWIQETSPPDTTGWGFQDEA